MMSSFYPEMDQTAPASALIVGSFCRGGVYVKWTDANHDQVTAALAAHKLQTRDMERFVTLKGETKWSATMTPKVYEKARKVGLVATELLLD